MNPFGDHILGNRRNCEDQLRTLFLSFIGPGDQLSNQDEQENKKNSDNSDSTLIPVILPVIIISVMAIVIVFAFIRFRRRQNLKSQNFQAKQVSIKLDLKLAFSI